MMEPDTQNPQVSSTTKKSKEAPVSDSAPSVRREKRMKWWMENTEKRLGPQSATDGAEYSEPGAKGHNSETKPKNPNYPSREMARGTGKGKSEEAKKKQEKSFTIFVGQIPFDAKEEEVKKLFETAGTIKTFRWRINPETKKFKGFAFVEYDNKRSFARAFQLHHALVNGRKINVEATIIGGHKSKHRAEHIKDWTARMQKEGAEALALKNAKKGEGEKPADSKTLLESTTDVKNLENPSKKGQNGKLSALPRENSHKKLKREGNGQSNDTQAESRQPESDQSWFQGKVNSFQKKREETSAKGAVNGDNANGKIENTPTEPPSLDRKEMHQYKSAANVPSFVKRKAFSADDRPLVVCGVKPKESHLASLIAPRLHIKFPE